MGFFSSLKKSFASKDEKDQDRYLSGLDKTKSSFGEKLRKLAFGFRDVDAEFLEELMIVLLEADIGIRTAQKIVDQVEDMAMDQNLKEFDEIIDCLIYVMREIYGEDESELINFQDDGPTVILMVGVNGAGKTTTTAKLTKFIQSGGRSVALGAADTFRAGAMNQLEEWANRLDVPCIKGREGGDPSSVLVDASRYVKDNDIDVLIGDTAGRLQNKQNLMNELSKMKRVVEREIPDAPHEVWLVIDATTGQNGISQAQIFMETTDVTGIILTKMDGTAKGGIVLAIKDQLGINVKFIGLGEQIDDLRPFDIDTFLYGISEGLIKEDNND